MKKDVIYRLLLILFTMFFIKAKLIAQPAQPVKVDSVVILFTAPPDSVIVTKTPLKYGKSFAMSFQEDDSHVDIYNTAYPLFEGNGSSGGLYYTDGCGNSVTFKMSTAMYIFNGLNVDLLAPGPYHVPDYLTWPQVKEMWEHNWGVENHGVSDPVTGHADYDIQRTQSYAKRKVNDSLYIKVFVQPNQGEAYYVPSQNNNYNGFLGHGMAGGLNADETGIDLNDTSIDWLSDQKINRIFDGNGYKNKADQLYASSQQGSNRWVPWGWHTTFTTAFSSELTQIYYTYGELGLDNILIAPEDEMLDYLAIKQSVTINSNLVVNRLTITFLGDVPSDRRFYALTLKAKANQTINSINVYGTDDYSVNGVGKDSALINLFWDGRYYYPMEYLADSFATIANETGSQYDALVAMDYVILMGCGNQKDSLRDVLCGLNHQGWNPDYDAGFCDDISFDLGNDTTVLINEGVQLNGPEGDYSYSWSTGDTLQNIVIYPATDTVVWLTISNNLNFCATDSINIFIHTFSFSLGSDTTICQGECVNLSGPDTMLYYQWITSDTIFDTLQNTTVCPVDTTTYILEVMDSFGYVTSDTIVVNVLPIPSWSLSADTTINLGECDTIFGPDGFASYYWYRADTLFDSIHQNVEVCPVDTTWYALVTTTSQGCASSDTVIYNVIQLEFSLGSDTSICLNSGVTLLGPESMTVYRWYESDTSNLIDTVQNITVNPVDTTLYILYAVDSIGAYNYDSIVVNILPLPDAAITYSQSVCTGNTSRVVVTPPTGYDNYIWHYNNQIDTSTVGVLVFVPNQSQLVSVEVVDNNLCKTEDDTFVDVWPNPILTAPNDTSVCLGDSLAFIAHGDGDIWWEDFSGNKLSDTNILKTEAIIDTSYIVLDSSEYGCLSKDTVSLLVLSLPQVLIHHPDTAVCAYITIELTATGAEHYIWSFNNEQLTGDTIHFYTEDTTGFVLEGESAEGCFNSDSAIVEVKPVPEVIAWGLLPAYCQTDEPDSLYATPEGGIFFGSGMVGNIFKPAIAGTGKQEVVYAYTDEATCVGYDTLFTKIYGAGNDIDLGNPDTLFPGDTLTLDAGEGFDNYLWNTGDTSQILTIRFGEYNLGIRRFSVVGVINNCTSYGFVDLTFIDPSAIVENNSTGFSIYPNPSSGSFTLSYTGNGSDAELLLLNLQGKVVYSEKMPTCIGNWSTQINLPPLPNGIYLFKWQSGIVLGTSKILIDK